LAKHRAEEAGQREAEGEVSKSNNQAQAAREAAERRAREAAAASGRVGSEPSGFAPQELTEAARRQAAIDIERLQQLGQIRAGIKEREAKEKADEIERQAANLADQLLNDRPSAMQEVKLNPVGTNLYVRNYLSVPSKVAPLRAQAGKINDLPTKNNGRSTAASITQATTNNHGRSDKITGKLLDKQSSVSANGDANARSITEVTGEVLKK
jgi:hypothetical protein